MKYFIALISILGLLAVQATEVDFSKAYLLAPVESDTALNIAGIQTINQINDDILNWNLSLEFNPDDTTFSVVDSTVQSDFDVKLVQQRLRDTIWKGDYKTSSNFYETELHIKVVQAGFIGAEVIHYTLEKPEPSSFLNTKLIGDIYSQYLIDTDQEGDLDWVYVDEYERIVAEINDESKESEFDAIPKILAIRHLMRLKRGRKIGTPRHSNSSWGTFNEYRLTIENDQITGSVGKPLERYGDKNTLTGNGSIELTMVGAAVQILE